MPARPTSRRQRMKGSALAFYQSHTFDDGVDSCLITRSSLPGRPVRATNRRAQVVRHRVNLRMAPHHRGPRRRALHHRDRRRALRRDSPDRTVHRDSRRRVSQVNQAPVNHQVLLVNLVTDRLLVNRRASHRTGPARPMGTVRTEAVASAGCSSASRSASSSCLVAVPPWGSAGSSVAARSRPR